MINLRYFVNSTTKQEGRGGQRIPVTLGNIAPLSLRLFQPGRIALVCEGGGQRGIFTAGVLDEFMRAQFNPFDLYLGTSAGRRTLAFICNQPGYARKVIMRYTTKREFFDPLRFVRGGNLINLDWLVEATASQMPLQMDTAARSFDSGKSFYMCACRQDDYAPNYFLPTKQNWLDVIRASVRYLAFIVAECCWKALTTWMAGSVMRFRLKRRQGRALNVGRHPHCAVTNVLHAAVVQTHGTLAG